MPHFSPISLSSGLAVAIRDQENHGFLFADVGHDGGQLVDVAAVEMLRLPEVQDPRGGARFGCKETHVSAGTEEKIRNQFSSAQRNRFQSFLNIF